MKNKTKKQMNDQQRAMVVENMDYAKAIARRYVRQGVLLEDLEQEACEALCYAAMRFDASRGCTLATFSTLFINGWLSKYIMRHCQHSYLSKQQRMFVRVISLELLKGGDDDEMDWDEMLNCEADDEAREKAETVELLDFLMSHLTAEEQEIISRHSGLDGDALTLTEQAEQMGVNRITMSLRCKEIMMKMAVCAEKYNVER